MLYSGTDLKFKIKSTVPGFVLNDHDFRIAVTTQYGRVLHEYTKDDCFHDTEDNWYFTLENVTNGAKYARFFAEVPDADYNKQVRVITDMQLLCFVGHGAPQPFYPCPCQKPEHMVEYEQVWTVNLDDGTYLSDSDGNLILVDGHRVSFPPQESSRVVNIDMTGNEFKTLIEGNTDDGKINTMPEVMEVMSGLDEDTELTVMTDSDVDDMMSRVLADDSSSSS